MSNKDASRVVFYMLAFVGLKVAMMIGIRKAAERMSEELSDLPED